jgi:hypothetical protein
MGKIAHLYNFHGGITSAQSLFHRWGGSMKRLHYTSWTLLFVITILFANPYIVLANEGDDGHQLEVEVNGYHVTLESQNEWAKGENIVVVTLTDGMGMPVSNADVEILVAPKSAEHAESEAETAHGTEQQHDSMSGMDMDEPTEEAPSHDEEIADPISMLESGEHGMYMVETHLESSGKHDVHVMFHANGEMFQADFIVEIPGANSKTIVLWSFVMFNVALVASAGIMKRQLSTVKGGQ